MQPIAPIIGVDIKLARAEQVLRDLGIEVAAFLESNPYRLVAAEEGVTGDLVYRVVVQAQLPLEWAAIVGDVVHNLLRSCLDYLAWQLVLANDGTPDTQTMFPFSKSATTFEDTLKRRMKGASAVALGLVRATRPYPGGNDQLVQLHELDIEDKHRLLIPVASAHRNIIIDTSEGLRHLGPEWADLPPMPVAYRVADRQYPLRDGAEVLREVGGASSGVASIVQKLTFEVAFGQPGPSQGEPLLETLEELVQVVRGVVAPFRPLLAAAP